MKGLEFYVAAAQVIPILMVVLIFEVRMFRPRAFAKLSRTLIATNAPWFVSFAEYRALKVTYVEDAAALDPWLVTAALFLLWNAFIIAGVLIPMDRASSNR